MSYPYDSEISDCSYGCSYATELSNTSEHYAEKEASLTNALEQEFSQRKTSALWFVSNCGADFRNDFALSLMQHINVRIYGKCREQFELNFNSRLNYRIYSFAQCVLNFLMLPIDIIRYFLSFFSLSNLK